MSRRRGWPFRFFLLVSVVYLSAIAVVHTAAFGLHPDTISHVVAVVLVVAIPIAYWLLIAHRGIARPRSILLAVVCSVLGARLVLPAAHRSFVSGARYLTLALELAITGYAIWRVQRALRRPLGDDDTPGDVVALLNDTLADAFGQHVWVPALAMEIATFYYALGGSGDRPPRGALTFALDTSNAKPVMIGVGLAIAIETPAMHLLLARWSLAAALVLTAFSLYSILWLVGDYRATRWRPLVLNGSRLTLRVGLRYVVDVQIDQLHDVRLVSWNDASQRAPGYLNTARPGHANVVLEFATPIRVTSFFGVVRRAQSMGVRLTEPKLFRDTIEAAATAHSVGRAGPHWSR